MTSLIISFTEKYPLMNIKPSSKDAWIVQGRVDLDITHAEHGKVIDSYLIEMRIPKNFPREIPQVFELEKKIPKVVDYHTYTDGSLCLGSPLSVKKRIFENPTVEGFLEECIVPYLFAMSLHLKNKNGFVFGELYHGTAGVIQDYIEIFGLKTVDQLIETIDILSMKKRVGNKQTCPCGCERVITRCRLIKIVNEYRDVMTRSEFKSQKEEIMDFLKLIDEYKRKKQIPLL